MMVMELPALKSTDVLSTPHQDSTSIALETNPPSNSNEEGVAEELVENQERDSPLTKAISELQSLSNVLQKFHSRWDELQKLVDFIENAIESKEKQLVSPHSSDLPNDSVINVVTNESESASLTIKDTTASDPPGLQNQESEQKNPECEEKPPTSLRTRNNSKSELESICSSMASRDLRRYITHHFPQPFKLRQEVPLALRHAPNPAELVLKSVGKFYVQSQKAFLKNPTMISVRKAALLILECFLLMGHNRIDESVKEESKQAVLAWKKRLITEGGLSAAGMQDARGLLLLVGCFGIPDKLSNEDLIHLLRVSNPGDISEALRKSSFLLAKVPEIIEYLVNRGMAVEALDIVYTFGLEEKLLLKTVSSFLKSLKDAHKKAKGEAKGSPAALKQASEKQLTALKSLMKCFEAHKADPAKVMPGWKLKEKITKLEKDIAELDMKIVSKRKAEEHSSTVLITQNSKRPKVGEKPLAAAPVAVPVPVPVPSPFSGLQESRVTNQQQAPLPLPVPVPSPFSGLQESRVTNHQQAPLLLPVPVPSPFSGLQESRVTNQQQAPPPLPVPSSFRSLQEPRVNNQQPLQPPLPTPSPFSSLVDPRVVTNQHGYQLGSRYSDSVHDHPPPSAWHHGYEPVGISNRGSLVRPSFGASISSGSSFRERPVDHDFVGSTELGSRSFMEPSSLSEGFRIAPSFGGASQSSSSDLYSFADVIDTDYARNAYKSGDASGLTSYRPST